MTDTTARPGIRFQLGQSHSDLSALNRDLGAMRDMLRSIRQEAKQTASSLNGIKGGPGGLVDRSGRPFRRPEPEPASRTATRAPRQQKTPVPNADRNIFAGLVPEGGATEAQWKEAGKKVAERREKALMDGMDLNRTERQTYSRVRSVASGIRGREREAAMASPLGRVVNAAGWSPFVPQSAYMLQMMMGEMGLGLPLAAVAGGMGLAGLGALAIGANTYATAQARTGQELMSAAGSPFAPATYATGADFAKLLQQRTGANGLNLPGQEGQQAVSALAAGGLSGSDAFGTALDQAAALINGFGLSVQDAANMVTTWRVEMGDTTQQTAAALADFGKVAQATQQPLSALGQIAVETPNLLANQTGPGAAVEAAVLRTMGGSTQGGIALGSVVNASGAQALSIAAQMGLTDAQFNQLQSDPTGAGPKRIADWTVQLVQRQMAQSGGNTDMAMLAINGRLGTDWDKATINRLNALSPTVGLNAFNQALNAPTPQTAPGAASNVNALIGQDDFAKASSTANPPSVPGMVVNAAQVWLTGTLGNAGNIFDMIGQNFANPNAPHYGGNAAIAQQLRSGPPLAGSAYDLKPPPPASSSAAPAQPAPGGGGGGVVTLNLLMNGQRVGSVPVAIQNGRPSQQYQQYVPPQHRGP